MFAGVSKLRRQGLEHSSEVSEISDGLRTPEDTESITSDIFGVPEIMKEGEDSFSDTFNRSILNRMDENSLANRRDKQSISREVLDERPVRYTSARPVARRSVSRELFDLKYNSGKTSPFTLLSETGDPYTTSPVSHRLARYSREGSITRDTELSDYEYGAATSGYRSSSLRTGDCSRSTSLSRTAGSPRLDTASLLQPSRPLLSVTGRSTTHSEILRSSPLTVGRINEDGGSSGQAYGGSLRDRKRQDWRRISVPERGKDFNSLPRKYNRYTHTIKYSDIAK